MRFFPRRLLNWLGCEDRARVRPAPRCRPPTLEVLEDRTAPALLGSQIPPSSLSGFVYCDMNHDGRRDPGDPGIAGTQLFLLRGSQVVATTFTGPDGSYQFSGLGPGTYMVVEGAVPPSPTMVYVGAYDTVGSLRGASRGDWGQAVQPDVLRSIHVGLAQTGINYNFAVLCATPPPVPPPPAPVLLPGITILKYISALGGDNNFGQTHVTSPGQAFTDNVWQSNSDSVTFTYYVTNTGQLPLTNITVNDDGGAPEGTFIGPPPAGFTPVLISPVGGTVLLPGQTWIFTSGVSAPAQIGPFPFGVPVPTPTSPTFGGLGYVNNKVTVTGLASNGATVTASDQSFYFVHFNGG
jgi:hypothetical protein